MDNRDKRFSEYWAKTNELSKLYGVDPVEEPIFKEPEPEVVSAVSYPWALFAVIFFLVSFTTLSGDTRKIDKIKQHEIFQQE